MAQVASGSTSAPSASDYGYRPDRTDPTAGDFGQALQDAGYDPDARAPDGADARAADDVDARSPDEADDRGADAVDGRDDEKDAGDGRRPATGKKRKGGDAGGLLGLFAGRPPERFSLRGRIEDGGGKGALGELVGGGAGSNPKLDQTAAAQPADLDAFADMLDQAAGQAPLQPNQVFQLSLGEARLPVSAVEMTRQPDGSLSLTLQADSRAVTEVRATLEALRRRLQAKGLAIADLTVEGEFTPDVPDQDTA